MRTSTPAQGFINGSGRPGFAGTCNFCHANGGANVKAATVGAPKDENRNFNTNIEAKVHPARCCNPNPDPNFPKDGGFGRTDNGDGTFGNRTFNTASVVEAADTAPFFHNNVVRTLKEAVAFYSGPEFLALPPVVPKFDFTDDENELIADFLRGINTLQNIDVAKRELQEILDNKNDPLGEQDKRLQTAFEETQDAIEVLTGQDVFQLALPDLNAARADISQALLNTNPSQRRQIVQQAIDSLTAARGQVGTGG